MAKEMWGLQSDLVNWKKRNEAQILVKDGCDLTLDMYTLIKIKIFFFVFFFFFFGLG